MADPVFNIGGRDETRPSDRQTMRYVEPFGGPRFVVAGIFQ
jgi:hypothetical protein